MAIARTLKHYLEKRQIQYDTVTHPHSDTTEEAAHFAHVPSHQVAKAVVLEDRKGYVLGVIPSENRVNLTWVSQELGRRFELATERELPALFQDCDLGAVPPIGEAYGLDVVWDDQLMNRKDIYIEAGDHETLIHMNGESFEKLMGDLPHNIISASGDYDRPIYE
jgi:Ala-tRNA(Pro) deacylase